ncbi:MAG: FtsW/RodA/SpoVE family cell cycle protein [Candidatus Shapirobacteria bacterium]
MSKTWAYTLSLTIIGLFFISISTLFEAQKSLGDPNFFIRKQIFWIILGIISAIITSKINLDFVRRHSFTIYLASIALLIIVLIPSIGQKALGASRWINFGFFNLQPSEFFKLAAIIFFPALFTSENNSGFKHLLIFLLPPLFLIVIEPNLSTAILIAAIVVSSYYLSGGQLFPIFILFLLFSLLGSILIFTSPYRKARFDTLVNTQKDDNLNYHSQQIIISLSAGGLSGKGIANSEQKYKFLPKISTDSILAIIGEETGFIGLFALTSLYLSFVSFLFKLANIVENQFEKVLVSTFACWIAYQALINFSAIVALIPLTGVPFPFISYGGSSLLSIMIATGFIVNIEGKYTHDKKNINYRHTPHSRHRIN